VATLLLDRASFPRDKPCGGGVTARAASLLPFALDTVVESAVDQVELGLRYGRRFLRRSKRPLVLMTERKRLDAFLVARATDAGVVFRDEVRVTDIELRADRVIARHGTKATVAGAVIGADGVNGTTARRLGIAGRRRHLVALEADIAYGPIDPSDYERRLVLELGTLPGGYAWIFPKAGHLNVGVLTWERNGADLRNHLQQLVGRLDIAPETLENVRGYRLPLRSPGDSLTRGRALLVGDAAGLVDPLLGEGIHAAFLSARLGADAVRALIAGETAGLERYAGASLFALGRPAAAAWAHKAALDCYPRLAHAWLRTPWAWRIVRRTFQQEPGAQLTDPVVPRVLGRISRDPGRPYRAEAERAGFAAASTLHEGGRHG